MKTLTRWDEWCEAWSKRAKIHEDLGRAALEAKQFASAGEHLGRAAVTYHFAKYLFVNDMKQMRAAHTQGRRVPHAGAAAPGSTPASAC